MKQTLMTRSTSSGFLAAGWRCGSLAGSPFKETGVRCSSLIAFSYPESGEGQHAHAEGQSDETFGDRTEPTESEATRVDGVLDLGRHVLHDVVHLRVTEVAGEARHVGGAGANRFGDFYRRNLAQGRREGAHRQGVPVAFDRVTRRAVEGEESRAIGDVGVLQVWVRDKWEARRKRLHPRRHGE